MLLRPFNTLAAATLLSLALVLPAAAAIFTFELGDATGSSSSRFDVNVALTVDPGAGGLVNRTFYASDITRIDYSWITSFGSTARSYYGMGKVGSPTPAVSTVGPLSFINTDAAGRGTLALSSTGPESFAYFQQYVFGNPWVEIRQGANSRGGSGILFQWRYGSSNYMQINSPTNVSYLSQESYPSLTPPSSVPVPASVLGLMTALAALGVTRRRRKTTAIV